MRTYVCVVAKSSTKMPEACQTEAGVILFFNNISIFSGLGQHLYIYMIDEARGACDSLFYGWY